MTPVDPADADLPHRVIHTLHTSTVVFDEYEVSPGVRVRDHGHDVPHLVLVTGGGMIQRVGRHAIELNAGTIRATGPAVHDLEIAPCGLRCLVIELPAWREWPHGADEQRTAFVKHPALANAVMRLRRYHDGPDTLAVLLELDVAELFATFRRVRSRKMRPVPRWLMRTRELLADTVVPDLQSISREVGVHPDHIVRAFRDHFGMGTADFLRRHRASRAIDQLRRTDTPMAIVALESGFFDQSHMTRDVRALTGMTPGAVRRARINSDIRGNTRRVAARRSA